VVLSPPAAFTVRSSKLHHELLLQLLLLWLPGIYPACSDARCTITACYFYCLQRQAPPLAAAAAAAASAALHLPCML
jgi:hypothetical protein